MSGNGGDNAHNNQFGGGSRGPTGGVNAGSGGSTGSGHHDDFGYWDNSNPNYGSISYDAFGKPLITINKGPKWVHDNSMHGPGGSGNGDGNLKTNQTTKTVTGYQAVINGYVYTITVNGNDTITAVHLFSRPSSASRKSWAQSEASYINQARSLVQAQLDAIKAVKAAAAKKAAVEAAAAEAKRKADEEAKRKQAEWDAAHPLEAAQRDVNNASASVTAVRNKINADNVQINSNNNAINSRQPQVDQLNTEMQRYGRMVSVLMGVDPQRSQQILGSQVGPRQKKRDQLQVEINNLNSKNSALKSDIATQNNNLKKASSDLSAAQSRLTKAQADAAAKRKAEAARQAAEAARVKAAQDAAAKAKAEADAKAKAEAQAATKAAALEAAMSKLEQPNVFGMSGFPAAAAASASPIAFAETGLGTITVGEVFAAAAWTSVRTVLADLTGAIIAGSGLGALIASVAYIPGAGEGSDKVPGREDINMFLSAMPADALSLPAVAELKTAASVLGSVNLPVRGRVTFSGETFKTYLVRTTQPTPVRVLSAVRDDITGLYGFTIPAESELPSRTILVSPDLAPGSKGLQPLVNPQQTPSVPDNTGNQNPVISQPIIESFPMADDLDFRDAILIFPEDTGLKPTYVMLQSARDMPGKVEGAGSSVTGTWLADSGKDLGAPVPSRIADKLRDKEFRNFDAFREAFWQEVSADPELSGQFKPFNVSRMKKGLSPRVRKVDVVGGRVSFELHHVKLISLGGDVYNIDNIRVVTPKRHINIHSGK